MNFPHNGKSLAEFSTQWKRFVHASERRAVARTHNAPVSGGIPSAQVAGLDWLRYLSETGHGSQYDAHCQCSFCESVRREYPRWLSEHPNTPGQRSAAQGEDHAKS